MTRPQTADPAGLSALRRRVEDLPDPELPVITLGQMGVVRSVEPGPAGRSVVVELTPTYSGCPAVEVMQADIEREVVEAGYVPDVRVVLSPAWSTDWISDGGRKALHDNGIAPPTAHGDGPVPLRLGPTVTERPPCPHCGSGDVEELSRFGGTACLGLWRCLSCREPFDAVRPL